jgi:hypothetical protein
MPERVQIPAAYADRWMMGDRYGEIVKVVRNRAKARGEEGREIAHVKLDKSGKTFTFWLDECSLVYTAARGVNLEHRHFAFIAATLRSLKPSERQAFEEPAACDSWRDTVQRFASECASSNPRFDRRRFLAACGWEG